MRHSRTKSLAVSCVLATALMAGCATVRKTGSAPDRGSGGADAGSKSLSGFLGRTTEGATLVESSSGSAAVQGQAPEFVVNGIRLQNTRFDIPIVVNSQVENWVDYFTGRGRKHFEKYLERSEFFVPYIRPLLRQNGLPEDLVYLAMIESGFNNHARSHAKAVGPWQFISATGKRYGLMVNWWVDERRDTRKSTLAAVEYLRDLYGMFQNWELAAASYNAGEAKVARAIRRYGSKDFWVISRHRFLRRETRDYVPKIMAAALIAKNPTQFGFKPVGVAPGKDEAIAPDGEVVKVIKDSNPHAPASEDEEREETISQVLKQGGDLGEEYEDAPEPEFMPTALQGEPSVSQEPVKMAKPIPTPTVNKKGEIAGEELVEFEVQSPADLLQISRAAGLSYQTVKSLNPELLRWCTPPTVGSFRIKLPVSVKDKFLTTYNDPNFPRKVQFMTYKVHRGETLTRIARQFGIRVDPISDLNGVSSRLPLRKGARVVLPLPNDRTRSLASLEVRDPPERKRRRSRRRGRHSSAEVSEVEYRVGYKTRAVARSRSRSI